MSPSESYGMPLTARNLAYSAVILAVVCFGLWGFWQGAIPPAARPAAGRPLIVRYNPRSAGTMGVTWSSVPIGLPNRIGFDGTAERTDARFQAFLTPPPMSVELASEKADLRVDRTAPIREWAEAGLPAPGRYYPVAAEPRVFGPVSGRPRSALTCDWLEGLQGVRWVAGPVFDESLVRPQSRSAGVIAWVALDAAGAAAKVLLEQPSGQPETDRMILRGLYGLRAGPGQGGREGRVRVGLAGGASAGSVNGWEKE